jgi:retron-type reverse transcriptase
VRQQRIERVKRDREERKARQAQEKLERAEKDKQWRAQTLPHVGREVSKGLRYEGGDEAKLQELGLPFLHTAEDIAAAMEISTAQLAWLAYHRAAAPLDHYRHFSIPKKSGGTRSISAPKSKLRAAQSWLLQNVLMPVPLHEAAVAFRPQMNITDNARRHAGADVIVRIDLKDFFPSITFRRVKRLFESLGYNEGVATILALIATEAPRVELLLDGKKHFVAVTERFLPQGACTSPAITNLLCRRLDARLQGAARKLSFEYSRYADDLLFSSKAEKPFVVAMRDLATRIITDEKLMVNEDKTAIMRPRGRQTVTGLVVNARNSRDGQGAPRVSRRDIRRFRAFLHQYETLGRQAMTEKMGQDSLAYARGYLSFIHMVSPEQEQKIRDAHTWLQR